MSRLWCALTAGLLLLLPTPASAIGTESPHFVPPVTLHAEAHLDPGLANPGHLRHPRSAALIHGWPATFDIEALTFGAPEGASRRVLLIGGIHGDEAVSFLFAELLRRQLEDEERAGMTDGFLATLRAADTQLVIIPCLNPYGTLAGLRPNFRRELPAEAQLSELGDDWLTRPPWWDRRRGVDLNRNFPVNLSCSDPALQRDDGEGTHQWDAPGGCHQQEYYYGGLLDWTDCAPEPANQFLLRVIRQLRPDMVIALHQEARVMYVDVAEPLITAAPRWAPFIEAMHEAFNASLLPRQRGAGSGPVTFGRRVNGSVIAPEVLVNDFSPGGYGAALSLYSGVVMTLELTHDQSDAETDACWFPEGMLLTYTDDLSIRQLRAVDRLDTLLSRFRGPLLQWILTLDPECPDHFELPSDHAVTGARLLVPRMMLDQLAQ